MTKKLLLSLASIFLTYRSVELLKFLDNTIPGQFNWMGKIAFSFALNLFITGIFAFLGFAFLTSKILPNSYYKVKNSENLILIYKILGVEYFKLLLLKFFWGKEKNRKKYFNGTKSIQPQRRGRPVVDPNSRPSCLICSPTSSSNSVGNGPLPTRVQ